MDEERYLKIEPLKIRVERLIKQTIKEKRAIATVENQILERSKFHAKLWLDRYRENPRLHWVTRDAYNDMVGLIGEEGAWSMLNGYGCDLHWVDPLWARGDPRADRPFDLHVAGLGSIEVKTVPPIVGYRNLLVKVVEWSGAADYVLAVKLYPEVYKSEVERIGGIDDLDEAVDEAYNLLTGVKEAWFMGWLEGRKVEKLPVSNLFGPEPCRYKPLKDLEPMWSFFDKLDEAKEKVKRLEEELSHEQEEEGTEGS